LRDAVPALEALCRRFAGFGREKAVPEQAAALDALAAIGGKAAAHATAALIVERVVEGPNRAQAIAVAARLDARRPAAILLELMVDPAPGVRAAACAAPILISTNRDVTAVTPDLRKRMVVCHIDGARPRGMSEAPARAALSGIGTALYRAYLDRFVPQLGGLQEALAQDPHHPPDLLLASSTTLAGILAEALGEAPAWARPVAQDEIDRLKDKPLLDQLAEIIAQNSERARINRASGDLVVDFAGDHHQAARFEKLVPAQALKGRFADAVKLDLDALERDFGFAPNRRAKGGLGGLIARLLGR
jgi:hypothetical protein